MACSTYDELSNKELIVPRSTACFPFEQKVFQFATAYSNQEFGDIAYFRLEITAGGTIAHTDPSKDHPRAEDAEDQGTFEFDPFDWPEYAHISWSAMPRELMERLIGVPIESIDLASDRETLDTFPDTWSVVF